MSFFHPNILSSRIEEHHGSHSLYLLPVRRERGREREGERGREGEREGGRERGREGGRERGRKWIEGGEERREG